MCKAVLLHNGKAWDAVADVVILWRYERCCVLDKRTVKHVCPKPSPWLNELLKIVS